MNRRLYGYCLVVLLATSLMHSPSDGASGPEIAKRAFQSTVILVMEDAKRQPLAIGSGFFVGSSHVVTNMHVIEDAKFGYGKVIGQQAKFEIVGTSARDASHDLVILETGRKSGFSLPWSNRNVEIGEEVYAIGNPQGLEGTFSKGIVSGLRKLADGDLIQITAPISPGSSGGPVLDMNGEVIGIAVATYKDGQNLNFAIPVAYLRGLMPTLKPASPLNVIKRDRSAISPDLGGRITEGVVGYQFLWSSIMRFTEPTRDFSFSLKNQLRTSVSDVECLVVFNDNRGEPLDVAQVSYRGLISPGLAKRVTNGKADQDLVRLTSGVDIRVLNFKLRAGK